MDDYVYPNCAVEVKIEGEPFFKQNFKTCNLKISSILLSKDSVL